MSIRTKSIFVFWVLAMAAAVQGCPSDNEYLLIERQPLDVEAEAEPVNCIAFSDTFPGSTAELSVGTPVGDELIDGYTIAMNRVGDSMLFRVTTDDGLIVEESLDAPFILSGAVKEVEVDFGEWGGLFRYSFQGVSTCPEGTRAQDSFFPDAGMESARP